MEQILIGVLSGVVTAVILGLCFYHKIESTMEQKMHKYAEALLKFQQNQGVQQTKEMAAISGKVQQLGSGVDQIGKALSNVKTRGIYGEWQLGSLMEQLLRPEQYETECMPGKNRQTVYLPVDSKFPLDAYMQLMEARQEGEDMAADALDLFKSRVKRFAKEVHDKYIMPPYTTDFAILFFPFEGVYTEVLQTGIVEELMVKYRITVAGPSTLGAILNGLQVGFRSVALDEKTEEVRQALSGAGEEVKRFEACLLDLQKRLDQSNKELEQLMGVRLRKLKKKLEYFDI